MTPRVDTVEVFRTNVNSRAIATRIIECLSSSLEGVQVNFDLEDVDRILRVATAREIEVDVVVAVVRSFGLHAEVLPDIVEELVKPLSLPVIILPQRMQ